MKRPKTYHLILTAVLSGIIAVVSYASAVTTTLIPGVAALYPAAALEIAFGIWFGLWGAFAAYIGVLIAGVTAGWFSPQVGILIGLGDFMLAAIPAYVFRKMNYSCQLKRTRDIVALITSSMIASILGSLLYNWVNLVLGVLQNMKAFWLGVLSWNIGNLLIVIVIAVPLVRALSRVLEKSGFTIKGLFE